MISFISHTHTYTESATQYTHSQTFVIKMGIITWRYTFPCSGSEMEGTLYNGLSGTERQASSARPRGQGTGGVGMCARRQYMEYRCTVMHTHLF